MTAAACLALLGAAAAQQAGTLNVEGGPSVPLRECTVADGCEERPAKLVLDSNWRWVHDGRGQNCYKDDRWVARECQDPLDCAATCALEGVTAEEYRSTYGIEEVEQGVRLKFVTEAAHGANFGSRLYLMDGDDAYNMFRLKNREFSLTIDTSELPCGLNGAVYFVEMDRKGGKGTGENEAGAAYGTGYCDAQCPHDIKFINGEANLLRWNESALPATGYYGTCCAEMDIWEANSMATAFTPHPCTIEGLYRCHGLECGDTDKGERYSGVCDKDGCDFNAFRMGNQEFYGASSAFDVDTTKPITVVTQFLTSDGTDEGDLVEIRRLYSQDGAIIPNSEATILSGNLRGSTPGSITDEFCAAQKRSFQDLDDFKAKGGMKRMGEALDRGMVLALSLWDDTSVNMLWLDSAYPVDAPVTQPGVLRGPCPGGESNSPTFLRSNFPDASVTYTDVAVGEIGSTVPGLRRLGAKFV